MANMYIVIFITAKDKEEAQKIGQHLVSQKLAACVNIVSGIDSIFWWENKVDTAQEALLIVKSRRNVFNDIVKAVRSIHSYSVPEIIAFPIQFGLKDYLKWIDDSVKPRRKK